MWDQAVEMRTIYYHRLALLFSVHLEYVWPEWTVIDEYAIYPRSQIAMDFIDEIGSFEFISFAMFGHQVTDIHLLRLRLADRTSNIADQQTGKEAGIKVSGADNDGICTTNGAYGLRTGRNIFGNQTQAFDW